MIVSEHHPFFVCDLCGAMEFPSSWVRWVPTKQPKIVNFWDSCFFCSQLVKDKDWSNLVYHVRLAQPSQTDLAVRLYLSIFRACEPVGVIYYND